MAKNPFKKPKPGDTGLAADLYEGIDIIGDYLEPKIQTGTDYLKSLGSTADDVTRNVPINKQNRAAAIQQGKEKARQNQHMRKRAPGAGRKVGYRKPVMDSKQISLEFLENIKDPKIKQSVFNLLESTRTGKISDTEAAQGISAFFPDKSNLYQPKINKTTTRFTKVKNDYFNKRRNDPKFEEDIYDIYVEGPNQPKPEMRDKALKVLEEAEKDVSMEPFVVKFQNAYSRVMGKSYPKLPNDFESVRRTAKAILKFNNKTTDNLYKGKEGQIFVGDDGVRTFVSRDGLTNKQSFDKDYDIGDIVKGKGAQHFRNIADSTGKPFSMVFREVTQQNPYVAEKLLDMRRFFDKDLGRAHFFGLDHIKPHRFGGTNSSDNLRFTMEGPHNSLKDLGPEKTLADIDVKNKSRMEDDVHKLALKVVDNVAAGKVDEAAKISEQIKEITNAFGRTYTKIDFHIGEPYVLIKTGANDGQYVKYADHLKLTPRLKKIVSELIPDQFRKPSVGKTMEEQVDQVYNIYADMFNIGGPINKEAMTQLGFFNEGGEVVVDEETGMMDYLTDNPLYNNVIKPIEEARDAKTEEYDLENNPQRVLPVMVGEALELPGEAYDALPNWLEGDDSILKNLGNPNAPSVILAKAASGLIGTMTDPVASLAKNVGDPDRVTTIPYPTWEKKEDGQYHYKDMQTLELPSDNPIAIGIDTLKAAGLGVAEAFLAFNPIKLIKLGANPGLAKKVAKVIVNDFAGPLVALTTAYNVSDIIDSKKAEELNQATNEIQNKTSEIVDNPEKLQQYEDAAKLGDSQNAGYGFSDSYANSGFAYGGEVTPGPFAESMQTGLEEEIDIQDLDLGPAYEGFEDLDIFEEAERGGNQPVEVALNLSKVVGDVPKWVKQGKERFKMAMDNLLPGRNTPETGTDVAIVDDVVENVTPLTRSEPGQIFYHQMEAELERGPKVYNSSKEVYDFLNARGIGKVEVIDSEIKPMLEKLEGMGQPITREMLLGVVRESPIRNVKSGGYGFLSDTLDGEARNLQYSGYKEKGAIPNTDRERVLYVDPQDLRGDTGNLPSSMSPHSFSEPYVIAWSRLSDRELGGAFTGKTTTFADEIQSDIFQASQRVAGKLAAKMRHMADQGIPFDRIQNDLQRDMMQYFKDKGTVFRESMPSASALKVEYDKLVALQNQLRELSKTPVPEITDEMLTAAKGVEAQQTAILDNLVDKFNLDLNRQLYPNLPFKLRDQWADASIKRDIYEAAYRKFVLKDPNATDYYAITPANLVTKRYGQAGSTKTPQADRIADKKERLERWVRNGMEGDIPNSQYPGVGMYEFYGGPGTDVVTEGGKHFTSSMEKTLKRIAKENNVKVEVLPVKIGDDAKDVWNVVNKETGEILGTGDTARQADAIANDLLLEGMKIKVDRTKQFDTAPSFGVELTPSMAEAFKAYMASGGYVGDEEIVGAYGD